MATAPAVAPYTAMDGPLGGGGTGNGDVTIMITYFLLSTRLLLGQGVCWPSVDDL